MATAILLIFCPDQKGITAKITDFIYRHNGNIEHADQHIDNQTKTFFMRIEWSLAGFKISPHAIATHFTPLAKKFRMVWSLHCSSDKPNVAVFTSKNLAVANDILSRYEQGQFNCKIKLLISNHPHARVLAERFNLTFFESKKTPSTKKAAEKKELALLKAENINTIILARYMQVFSPNFVNNFVNQIINIHHSFLPAFAGSNPYEQAYRCGVKIIGATSHYVTAKLDNGPIIEQNTVRISHRDSLTDLKQKGQDLEKLVLSRAVWLHLKHKLLVYNNKTVVFD